MQKIQIQVKYIVDKLLAIILLVLLSPVFIVISICIFLDSPGEIFFKQERIGYKGKIFKIYKFRTMVKGAETMGDGLVIKDDSDNRITKVGKILRKTSLDELPQLFNIIGGSMSFIGPRPPVKYHPYNGYQNYSSFAKQRFEMKPGITGLAQVKMRNSASWDDRIKVDINYVKKYSLILDIKILFLTIFSMINKEEYTA